MRFERSRLGLGVLFHLSFKVRARQIAKQHFEFGFKEIGPLLAQPLKKFLLVFQEPVQTAIQAVFCRRRRKTGPFWPVLDGASDPPRAPLVRMR